MSATADFAIMVELLYSTCATLELVLYNVFVLTRAHYVFAREPMRITFPYRPGCCY